MQINIIEYLERTLINFPDKTAIVEGDKSIVFKDLCIKSKAIANVLIQQSDAFIMPIAVYLPKSIESVIVDIAITYSGNTYMNLDVKTPFDRINNILALVQPHFIVTNSKFENVLKQSVSENICILNIDHIDLANENKGLIDERLEKLIDTDPYCIINTSGSTGTPKGVVLNHRSFIDFTEWAEEVFKFSNDEILGSLSPLVFDIYSYELCLLMKKGTTMVLIPDSLSAFPATILKTLQQNKVSFLFWVPTIMVNIANMDLLTQIKLPDLKTIWFAGEVFPTKQFNYWRKCLPTVLFANLYGPIEITLDCTYYIVERELKDDEPIPIGYTCRNTDILILDENNRLAQQGNEGELCVRGSSLAMGYYNNPEKTSAAFVQNPLQTAYPEIIYRTGDIVFVNEKGEIIFKGRKDSLVKHLGYRIELGEIEHVIVNTLKLVKNGCVVYNFMKKEIILFYEPLEITDVAELRKNISTALPKYMIPTVFEQIDLLPRNTNGKIDRLLLSKKVNG